MYVNQGEKKKKVKEKRKKSLDKRNLFPEQLLFGRIDSLPHLGAGTGYSSGIVGLIGCGFGHVGHLFSGLFRLGVIAFAVCLRDIIGDVCVWEVTAGRVSGNQANRLVFIKSLL